MDDLLTVQEVADRCRVHQLTIRRHIKQGRLRSVRVGRAVRVRSKDLDTYLFNGLAPNGSVAAAADPEELRDLRPITMDDPVFRLIGAFTGGASDVSTNKKKYIAEGIYSEFAE
ncbi:MAG: helix-turn-helix domain-containing protein [Dehalococcoidia bacterium]